MNLNELRIGNYVCTSYMKKSVFKVNAIHSDRLYFESIIENFKSDTIPIYVEPIKSTEELLLTLGFEKTDRYWSFTNDLKILIELDIEGNYCLRVKLSKYLSAFVCQVNFVHLLQNAMFVLCGEELVFSSTEP